MFKIKQLLPLCSNCLKNSNYRRIIYQTRPFSSKNENVDLDDRPIKYSTSRASQHRAVDTTRDESGRLWYEPYVLIVSIAAFLLYFCVFREENDVDKEMDRSLYSRIDGLEELQLKLSLKYNLDNGLDTRDIVNRLEEIEREKKAKVAIAE